MEAKSRSLACVWSTTTRRSPIPHSTIRWLPPMWRISAAISAGAGIQDYPLAHSLGKHTWMAEYLVNDQTINAAVDTAQQISDTLTVGNMSAYIWWKTIGDANGF
jgi:hypothetical protein